MTENQIKLVIGSLLHDIGKVVYRSGDGRNHSQSGYDYLKNQIGIQDKAILNCVRFHHGCNLRTANVETMDNAYVAYYADNIAASADRREGLETEDGFDREVPLASIFNILNGNHGHSHFRRQVLDPKKEINYPTEEKVVMDEAFYREIIANITDNLRGISISGEYVNSLLAILEANLSYVPSSTSKRELADISLYDHLKMTAAIAQCVEQYLEQKGIDDYREKLFTHAKESYGEKMFLMYSMDISGIQNFIYTIGSEGALRGLRARSFYLEIVMEHMIDELLEKLSLSRANLIYCGGGHCYLLLPNTERTKVYVDEQEKSVNAWFLKMFGNALFVAGGYVACSADDLKNSPAGSYPALYEEMSREIAAKKAHRYGAEQIRMLNSQSHEGERECIVCRRVDKTDERKRCPVCAALEEMSGSILYEDFFTVVNKAEQDALPLPGEKFLVADKKESLLERMKSDAYVRSYTKNNIFTGKHVTTKLWVGNYTTGDCFEQFAEKAEGIKRIAILRADVDNLGKTFVYGFKRPDGDDRYVTLSRTATLSRQLSLFFKCYINQLMGHGEEDFLGKKGARNVVIVYSGGDDLFLAGAWNEVIEVFIDLKKALEKFTQNTLTISGGIGLYPAKNPINIMAKEVGELENLSKNMNGKNAVTLFDKTGTYKWDVFLEKVIAEKFEVIRNFFETSDSHGKTFLYHLLELLRNNEEYGGEHYREEPIHFARYVYLLSRMEPDRDSPKEQQDAYQYFSRKMYEWRKDPEERRQVVTAIYLYVYLTRDKEESQ